MRPRWHKILSDLLSHKVRSLLVIASIAVGLFAIGMISTSYEILAADIRSGYRAVNPANIQITTNPFDQDLVEHIANLPGIAQAQGAWNTSLQVRTAAGGWKAISIKGQGTDGMDQNAIARPFLLDGSWPPDDREIVLEFNKLDETGASLGDEVEIKLPSGTIRRLRITGIVQDMTLGSGGGQGGFFLADIQAYVDEDALSWLEQPEGYNTLYATVITGQEDRAAIQRAAESVVAELNDLGYLTYGSVASPSSEHPNVSYVDAMAAVIYLLGFLVVFLSGFLITNTFSALLNQQVEQIGVMKTIGASRRQIIGLYMVLILVFSLIALAIAIPLSNLAAQAMVRFFARSINFHVNEFRTVPSAFLLQVVVAFVVPQLAGILPILQGTRITVREALSGTASTRVENVGWIYRWLARLRGMPRPVLISLRNTFRRRSRLLLTLITLTLGGATFIATFIVSNSIESYIDRLGRYFLADVNLTLNQPVRSARLVDEVMQVPGVLAVEGWNGALATVLAAEDESGETVQVIAPPVDSRLVEPIMLEGRWLAAGDENAIVLSEIFRQSYPDLRVGDTLRLKIGTSENDWVIVGFFQFAGRSTGLFAYTSNDYLSRQIGMYNRAASYRVVAEEDNLTLAGQQELGRRIESHLRELGYEIQDVSAGKTLQETTSQGLTILTTFLLIMSLLLASVGSIGLSGTMSLNVMERTREIGIMRAVGGSNRAIIRIVLVEGIIIGLISWLLACVTALPISKQLADVMFRIIFARDADLALTAVGMLIWLGIVLVLSVVASAVPAFNASRLTIREVLAYE